jgi:hypothetical protein
MILFSAKKSAVHDMLLEALAHYGKACGLEVSADVSGFKAAGPIFSSSDKVVYSQSTGVASLLVMPAARLSGKRIVHYMHEPTSLKHKRMNTPPVKSLAMQAVQWFEMRVASCILVSRPELIDQAVKVFGASRKKFALGPLLMTEVSLPPSDARNRITYLGRIDEHRFFSEFLEQVPALAARGFRPTVLTGDTGTFERYRASLPPELEIFAERNFPEELKTRVVSETLCLWNPKRGAISQSAVTVDALRYGVAVLLTESDPFYDKLRAAGIALDFHAAMAGNFAVLDEIDLGAIAGTATKLFSEEHGLEAFRSYYLPQLERS